MFDASSLRVLAVDNTEFERRALYRLAALSEFDHVIVDSGTSAEHVARLRQRGVHVIVAGVGSVSVDESMGVDQAGLVDDGGLAEEAATGAAQPAAAAPPGPRTW